MRGSWSFSFLQNFIKSQFYHFKEENKKTRETLTVLFGDRKKTKQMNKLWTRLTWIYWIDKDWKKKLQRGLLVWEVKGKKDVTNQYHSEFELVIRGNTAMTLYIYFKGFTGYLDNIPLQNLKWSHQFKVKTNFKKERFTNSHWT